MRTPSADAFSFTVRRSNWCCGLGEVGNFLGAHHYSVAEWSEAPPLVAAVLVKRMKAQGRDDFTAFTATTVSYEQQQAVILELMGFRKVSEFKNKNSGNDVIIWVYGPEPKKEK